MVERVINTLLAAFAISLLTAQFAALPAPDAAFWITLLHVGFAVALIFAFIVRHAMRPSKLEQIHGRR